MVAPEHYILKPLQALTARVSAERVRLLCELAPFGCAAQLLAVVLIAAVLLGETPTVPLTLWAGYMAIASLAGVVLCNRYNHALRPIEDAARWERYLAAAATAAGLGWGVLAFGVVGRIGPMHEMLVIATVSAMAIGGLAGFQGSRLAFAGYAVPALALLCVALVARGDRVHVVLGVLVLVLLAFLAILFARASRVLLDSLQSQFQNESLLEGLASAELSLKVSLDEQQLMFDTAPVGIAIIRDRRIARCNRRLEEMFGHPRGGLAGASTRTLYRAEDEWRDNVQRVDEDLARSGSHDAEFAFCRRDGSTIWCRYRGRAVDRKDLGRGVIWVFEDLSEKKAAAERLAQARGEASMASTRLMDAIESFPDAFALFDKDDRLVLCNRAYAQTFTTANEAGTLVGLASEALVRASIARGEVVPPEYGADVDAWVAERVRRHRNPDGDGFVFQLGDGRWLQAKERRTSEGGIVGVHADITALKAVEEQVRHLANHDPLTGLPNRRLLQDRMTQAFNRAHRSQTQVAVMLVDLDDFKRINDENGHKVGDRVLQVISGRLRTSVRQADTVARLGGDEFVVVLPELRQPVAAARVAEKILAAVGRPIALDGASFHVRASIGVSLFPADGEDVESLLKCADVAMYRAKEEGRNVYGFYSGAGRSAA